MTEHTPPGTTVWTRDESGEYHDSRGNVIGRDRDGWHITIAPHRLPYGNYRGRTLWRAKLKVEELLRDAR